MAKAREGRTPRRRFWYFDSPLYADPLFDLSIALGAGLLIWALLVPGHRAFVRAYQAVMAFPSAFLMVGVVLGTPRSFIRGYKGEPR